MRLRGLEGDASGGTGGRVTAGAVVDESFVVVLGVDLGLGGAVVLGKQRNTTEPLFSSCRCGLGVHDRLLIGGASVYLGLDGGRVEHAPPSVG